MDNETKSMLKTAFGRLPKDLQEAILSADISGKFSEIANKRGLRTDQAAALENEVIMTIMNLEPIEDLPGNIEEGLGLSGGKTAEIVSDVNELIFKNIRSSMRAMAEKDQAVEEEAARAEEKGLNRDDILKEIENPELDRPIGAGTSEKPAAASDMSAATPSVATPSAAAGASPIAASPAAASGKTKSAFEEKFFKTANLPSQSADITESGTSEKKRPYGGPKVDPYREPLE